MPTPPRVGHLVGTRHFIETKRGALEAIFEGGDDGMGVVGRLVYAQKQVTSSRGVAHDEAGVERAGGSWAGRWGGAAVEDAISAAWYDGGGRGGADAAHVRSHDGCLVIAVVPLLIAILNSR